MRPILFWAFAGLLLFPLSVQGQEWDAEQMEVWETVTTCWTSTNIETQMACIHDDFKTWGVGNPVPFKKADTRAHLTRFFETQETVWSYFQPLSIDVRGDMAIVLYVMNWAERNRVTGEETAGIINWTEVFKKEGDRWLLLADHGTRVERD